MGEGGREGREREREREGGGDLVGVNARGLNS